MLKKLVIISLVSMLTACSICPKPMSIQDRYQIAQNTIKTLFADHSQKTITIDYYEALARSVKYNLDYRLKIVNIALQAGQLDTAVFMMLPSLNVSGSLYTRSNDYSVSGITTQGVSTGLSSSTPRTLLTSRTGASWNLLDFGMGYVKAKQQSDRVLIADEESRQQLQQMAQDTLTAYWVAYSAQELIRKTKEFQRLLTKSKNILERALKDPTIPKENILNYQGTLLDSNRKLIQLQYKYEKAMLDLKHLLFLPVDQKLILKAPPRSLFKVYNLSHLNVSKMDAVTLVLHPQLVGQNYQKRIAQFGLDTVLLQALPGITLNYNKNYDSNKFLLNNKWIDKSIDVAWNLLNLASLPAAYQTAQAQVQYETIKSMAMTMTALTESRYAFSHYQTLREEYFFAKKQTQNANALYKLNRDRNLASIASDQQVILAKMKAIVSKMDEDLLLSDLSVALGQLYLSTGVDIVPQRILSKPLPEATNILRERLDKIDNFADYIDNTYYRLFPQLAHKTNHTIQLYSCRNLKTAKMLKHKIGLGNTLKIAKTQYSHHNWYTIIYGKYNNFNSTNKYLNQLPDKLYAYGSWIHKTSTNKPGLIRWNYNPSPRNCFASFIKARRTASSFDIFAPRSTS